MPELPEAPDGFDLFTRPAPAASWRDRIVAVADATGTSPLRLAAGAVLAAVAVLVGLWLTRPAPDPTEVSLPFVSTVAASAVGSAAVSTTTEPAELVVFVAGSVARVGVVHLPPGSRVVDAVDAAGGLGPEADLARINLAALLVDGQRVYVPAVGEAAPAMAGLDAAGSVGETPRGPVDLNTADEAALDALPGIGPATARAILDHRAKIGRFTSVDQLLDVRGIGSAKLEELRPLVTV